MSHEIDHSHFAYCRTSDIGVVVISVLIIMMLTFPLPLPPAIPTTMGSIVVMLALERNE